MDKLNRAPEKLIQFVEEKASKRVGFYFESLLSYVLNTYPEFDVIAEHLQVHHEGKTLGEIDFIYRDMNTNEVVHLEVAVKFYLGSEAWMNQTLPLRHWLGPMINDRLDLKTSHLTNHQSQISHSPVFQDYAQTNKLPIPTHQSVLLVGYLFRNPNQHLSLPSGSAKEQDHRWFTLSSANEQLNKQHSYIILNKPYWLSKHHQKDNNLLFDQASLFNEVKKIMSKWHRPVLIASIDNQSDDGSLHHYTEDSRFFIVPDNWGGLSKPSQP
ncbi:DUF1853 family protein [Litoribacillus peritrichatus]|uniref:DUF1853 family protein n=2 Tax=Litoribacillus peritrichatus TaxID=718191 RepID=A0ABP7M5K7_9GAMM